MRRSGVESPFGDFPLADIDDARAMLPKRHVTAVAVPAAALLERTVVVPLAAERDVADLLRHEMESITPFQVPLA